jgi:MFS family permease
LIKRRRLPHIFPGWWIMLVTAIISGLGGVFYMQGFSALFKPLSDELSLSRAAASAAAGIGTVCNGSVFLLSGWLSDRYGPKWVIIAGICLMGAGLVLMNFITSLWNYYIVWGVIIAAAHALGFAVANDKLLTDWFISKRGLALGLRWALIGIIGVVALPLISWLIATQGWRMTCLIWAGVIFAGIPFALHFVKQRRPEYYGLLPDGAKAESGSEADTDAMVARGVEYAASFQETEFTLRQAMRTSSYWVLTVVMIIGFVVFQSFNAHCIPFLTDMGIDPIVASGMMAMMGFCTIPSRFLAGFIADRVSKERLKFLPAGALLLMALGIGTFLLSQTVASVYILLILFGLGSGPITILDIVIRGRYFGRKAYGSIQGSTMIFTAPISLLVLVYVGWSYDASGNYMTAFTLLAAMAAFAALLVCLVQPPKPLAHISDIRRLV